MVYKWLTKKGSATFLLLCNIEYATVGNTD